MDPNEIGSALSGAFDANIMSQIFRWTSYCVIAVLIITFVMALYFLIQYRYKIKYPELIWEDNGKTAKIWKVKSELARKVKINGTWKWKLLFKRKVIEPISSTYILPGRRVNLFRINDDGTVVHMPHVHFDQKPTFETIKPELREWALLELKETAEANQTEEAQKRILQYTIYAIILLAFLVGITVWLLLKYAGGVTDGLNNIAPQLSTIAKGISGIAPN